MEERPLDQELELAGDLTETSRYQYPIPHQIGYGISTRYQIRYLALPAATS